MSDHTDAIPTLYAPLDATKREVRFLRMRFDNDTNISCELGVFSLDDAPKYLALSYAWTEYAPIRLIYLNGYATHVRPNLYAYMKLMQREHHQDWIFIDALCINQDDLEERASQVGLMGYIYQNADEVVAWMGVTSKLSRAIEEQETRTEWERLIESTQNIDELFESAEPEQIRREMRVSFVSGFCQLSYWSRLWIVQEIILAEHLSIRLGQLHLRPDVLLHFLRKTMELMYPSEINGTDELLSAIASDRTLREGYCLDGTLFAWKILFNREIMATNNATSQMLADTLIQFSSHKCKVPQDRVYALLGLTGTSIQVDYQMSMIRLYTTVIIESILEENLGTLTGEGKPLRTTLRDWRNLINVPLNSCGLQPFHPTVALVTREVLELCGIIGHQNLSDFERYYSEQSVLRIIRSWLSDGRRHASRWMQTLTSVAIQCWMRLRRFGTSLLLAYYRKI